MGTSKRRQKQFGGHGSRGSTTIAARAATALLAAALLLAGCGDDDDDDGPRPTATATVVPTVAPTVAPGMPGAGLQTEIQEVEVAGGEVVVTFTLTDDAGRPIRPQNQNATSDDAARVRFTLAHVEVYEGGGEFDTEFSRYVNDVDREAPRYDNTGAIATVDAAAGVYTYTFATRLAEDADLSQTYSVGMQVNRPFQGANLSANRVFDTVPAGGDPEIREGTTTAACNTCHDPLVAHGSRREVRLCTLCHTQAAVDEAGTSVDFSVMVHKIHAGKHLPSVVNGPPGTTYQIEDAVFAEKHPDGTVTGVGFPRPLNDCQTCHADGATAHYATDRPAAAPCTSCHDDVNPSLVETAAGPPGTNHLQNRGFADGDCQFCHLAEANEEFDISVPGAHLVPERSAQLQGLNVEITGVANHGAGEMPMVSFKVTNNAGEALRDLSGLNRVAFTLGGPTSDYARILGATVVGGGASGTLTGPDAGGTFQYTFAAPLPADAGGTWSLGAEARRSVTLSAPEGGTRTVNEAARNPVVTFAVGDDEAEVRRVVVEDAKCETCHGEFSKGFSVHGNLRNATEYCVVCHNPNASDVARRSRDPEAVAAGDATAPIEFKTMIHKIHTGEELEQKPYLIYGFGPAPANFGVFDFSEVLFPGDRRNCETCHAEETYLLPLPDDLLPTRLAHLDPATGMEIVDGHLGPVTSACLSCHDGDAAAAHAETQTGMDGAEACIVCHAEGREFAVSSSHAR